MTLKKALKSISEDSGSAEVRAFLSSGGDVNARADSGTTLLHVASEHMNLELIELLVTSGADINAQDSYGQTPAHIAVDIDIDSVNQANENAVAADVSFATTLLLVRLGANLEVPNHRGESPRDWARSYSQQHFSRLEELLQGAA